MIHLSDFLLQYLLVAIYLRKSRSDGDATIDETLRRHKETLMAFLANHPELKLYKVYEEVVSGDSLYARPQMLQLLQDAEEERFDAVLCIDVQRLGRGDMSDQGMILNTFRYHNIKIITPRKVYDLNDEMDDDFAEMETFMGRRELKMIKRRLNAGTQKSISEGCYVVNAPYGYKNVRVNKKATLEIVEEEAKFVRMIFDMYVNHGVGATTIANTISAMGAKPHRADHFNRTSVVAILRNQVYIGKIVWNKKKTYPKGFRGNEKYVTVYHDPSEWQVYDGIHPPIIDEETFRRAGEILSSRYHKPYRDGTIQNPLCGILKCAICGCMMQRRPYGARKYQSVHLLCATKGCCTSSRLDYVEMAVYNAIKDELKKFELQAITKKPDMDFDAILSGIQSELKKLDVQEGRLFDFLEQGVYDIDTFASRRSHLFDRRRELKDQYQLILNKKTISESNRPDLVIPELKTLLDTYWKSDPSKKNHMLKSIIRSGTYYKEKGWAPNQFILRLDFRWN